MRGGLVKAPKRAVSSRRGNNNWWQDANDNDNADREHGSVRDASKGAKLCCADAKDITYEIEMDICRALQPFERNVMPWRCLGKVEMWTEAATLGGRQEGSENLEKWVYLRLVLIRCGLARRGLEMTALMNRLQIS